MNMNYHVSLSKYCLIKKMQNINIKHVTQYFTESSTYNFVNQITH